ncbi:MAG: 23S rRNA (guanosine(2251)-2'-O)-methyltransferase RlmB [Deltaproteobacteria bacterium]|nr:23S rRNA (guanosine(2251)-2'-O)-methyltransferase RlmB [Deltaproteobacteria bacterium]
MGRNTVREVINANPQSIISIFVSTSAEHDPKLVEALNLAQQSDIPVERIQNQNLASLLNSDSHQGIAAKVKRKNLIELQELVHDLEAQPSSIVLMLDGVQDPHNIGALLRTSECFNVSAVIWSKNKGPGITPVVTKTSSGASELVPICIVSNLQQTIKKLKEIGFWAVSADVSTESHDLYNFKFPEKTLLILGSEGTGASNIVNKEADFIVSLKVLGQIDSLNVSQAAAVFISKFREQFS